MCVIRPSVRLDKNEISVYCLTDSSVFRGAALEVGDSVYLYFPIDLARCSRIKIVTPYGTSMFLPDVEDVPRFADPLPADENLLVFVTGERSFRLVLDSNEGWYRYALLSFSCDSNFQLFFLKISATNTSSAGVWLSGQQGSLFVYPPYLAEYVTPSAGFNNLYFGGGVDLGSSSHVVLFPIYPSSNSSPAVAQYSDVVLLCKDPFRPLQNFVVTCPCPIVSGESSTPEYNTIYCLDGCQAQDVGDGVELNISSSSEGAYIYLPAALERGIWYSVDIDVNVASGRPLVDAYGIAENNQLVPLFSWCSTSKIGTTVLRCVFYYPFSLPSSVSLYIHFGADPYVNNTVFQVSSISINTLLPR